MRGDELLELAGSRVEAPGDGSDLVASLDRHAMRQLSFSPSLDTMAQPLQPAREMPYDRPRHERGDPCHQSEQHERIPC
jgi:hypothetical protein